MKIALVSPFSLTPDNIAGGVAAVTQYLANALVTLGHEVIVIAPGKQFAVEEQRAGVKVIWAGKTPFPGFLTYANQQRKQIFRLLDKLQPDVVHFAGVFGWSIHCSLPNVVTIHGIAEKDAAFGGNIIKRMLAAKAIGYMENKGRKLAKQVISISPYATKLLQKHLTGQIHHIDNPIDCALFAQPETSIAPQDKLICVGVVGERKNTLGVIRAFAKIKCHYASLRLQICGQATSETYLAKCKTLVKELGLESEITFTGNLNREELYLQIASAKGLLMMSKQETAPMSIAEAMALGVPCLAPREFGIPFMIDQGKNGFFVAEDTAESEWQTIAQSLNSKAWDDLSNNARESASRYHPLKVAKATVEVYQLAINSDKQA